MFQTTNQIVIKKNMTVGILNIKQINMITGLVCGKF